MLGEYGLVAFGAVVFLTIWKAAVVPELQATRAERAAFSTGASQLATAATANLECARVLRACIRDLTDHSKSKEADHGRVSRVDDR